MLYFSRWKIIAIVALCVAGIVFTIPNFFTREQLAEWPRWVPKQQMTLGLDLQGGAYMLLEVDTATLIKDRVEVLRDDVRRVLREDRIGYSGIGVQGNGVQVRLTDVGQADKARTKLNGLIQNLADTLLGGTAVPDVAVAAPEAGLFRLTLTQAGIDHRVRRATEQSIEVIRRRIDQLGTTEPLIARQGASRILVQVPGLQDTERLKTILQQTARLTFHMVEDFGPAVLQAPVSPDTEVLNTTDDPPVPVLVQRRALLSGEQLVDAQATFEQQSSEPVVSFRFDTSGAQIFAQVTQQNVGRHFAIVLDKDVITYPVIKQPITGGSGQISGSFTVQSANNLALLLRAGALPANLTIVEERTVGPGLGADSIEAGRLATIIGSVAVIVFMTASYGLLGVFANLAMIINVFFTFAVLSLLGATLSLPGIAGIVLSIGMAVDANVLIYERVREEQRAGRSAISAIDTGFTKAIGTITDSNLTTLIAAAVLFFLGTGPIRGFAVTLAIGNITSFFTAVTVTRLMVALWVRRVRPARVPL